MRAIVFSGPGEFSLTEVPDPVPGVARSDGSTAELVRSPAKNLHRLPSSVDLALAALIEPLSCAIHAYDLLPRLLGAHYLIYGAGTMGLIMAQLAVEAVEDGLHRVRRGGTFQQFGVAPSDAQARFSQFRIYNDELTVVGSMEVLHSYARAMDMFVAGALNAKAMVSHAYALADYGKAIETFRAGTGRKVQIRPHARESMELL
ncbi:MAG TPA: hypothetical protein VFB83_08285 [Propionibacteriaceae bacterium]|nr:hypothetical protein [Propionibacteriaceae bacterium]